MPINIANLVWITPEAEKIIAYCARVSSPENQKNNNITKLLQYCINHCHWSIFEMASMCVEIKTTRSISPQILRHRSFHFQEFSQRYSAVNTFHLPELRTQDTKNRQQSNDTLSESQKEAYLRLIDGVLVHARDVYDLLLREGVAKECARFVLPGMAETTLYMQGTIRDWIHYINLRSEVGTQKEHREIALSIKEIFKEQLPTIATSLGWLSSEPDTVSSNTGDSLSNIA